MAADDLAKAREHMRAKKLKKAEAEFERQWARHKPIIRDYLQGISGTKLAKKYNMHASEVFQLLKRYSVSRSLPTAQMQAMASKLSRAKNRKDVIYRLRACGGEVCTKIADDMERKKRYG